MTTRLTTNQQKPEPLFPELEEMQKITESTEPKYKFIGTVTSIGVERVTLTTNQQEARIMDSTIKAMAEAIAAIENEDAPFQQASVQVQERQHAKRIRKAQAAYAAAQKSPDAQVKALVEALKCIRDTTPITVQRKYIDHALAALPDELKQPTEAK